jgi:hypothetical protein
MKRQAELISLGLIFSGISVLLWVASGPIAAALFWIAIGILTLATLAKSRMPAVALIVAWLVCMITYGLEPGYVKGLTDAGYKADDLNLFQQTILSCAEYLRHAGGWATQILVLFLLVAWLIWLTRRTGARQP